MKKILLVYPARLFASEWGIDVWNLKPSLVNLFSYLVREKGLAVDVLDLEIELGNPGTKEGFDRFKSNVSHILKQKNFDIIAISCYLSTNYLSAKFAAHICKEINPQCTIVVGGHHASAMPFDFLYENSPFDFIVTGEGEIALLDICNGKFKKKMRPQIIRGAPLDFKKPVPLKLKEFRYSSYEVVHTVGFELSRGCAYNCSYCPESILGYKCRKYPVKYSIKRIEEAKKAVEPLRIGFMDSCFGLDKVWRRALLNEIIKRKMDNIFWAMPRIELLEKDDIDLFAKLNFFLYISLESGSEKILDIMQRAKDPRAYLKKCKAVIEYINYKKIPNNLFLILNYPGEDLDTFESTIRYLESLLMQTRQVSTKLILAPFQAYPGTPAYKKLGYYKARYGTFVRNEEWWKSDAGDQYILATDVIASEKLRGINPFLYWKRDLYKLKDILKNKLSKERISLDFVLDRLIYKDDRKRSFAFNLNMYLPDFVFRRQPS